MKGPRKEQDIDEFINNELDEIEGSTVSMPSKGTFKPPSGPSNAVKPSFALAVKKPTVFAKPNFGAPSANKKISS